MTFTEKLTRGGFKSLEQIIPEAKRLRDLADSAEADFIRAMMAVEASPLWTGCESPRQVTFGHWLGSVGVCSPERYDRGAKALRTKGVMELADEVGMAGIKILVECPEDKREQVAAGMQGYVRDHGGAKIPEHTARTIRDQLVGGKVRESVVDNQHARIVQLAEELKAAKAKITELERENRMLREKLHGKPKIPGTPRDGATL